MMKQYQVRRLVTLGSAVLGMEPPVTTFSRESYIEACGNDVEPKSNHNVRKGPTPMHLGMAHKTKRVIYIGVRKLKTGADVLDTVVHELLHIKWRGLEHKDIEERIRPLVETILKSSKLASKWCSTERAYYSTHGPQRKSFGCERTQPISVDEKSQKATPSVANDDTKSV